ncbi:MAG: hypothetical protein ABWK01_05520 [Infirmifilum sp.]
MRAAVLVSVIVVFLAPIILAAPSVYVSYAEVLEYNGSSWRSSYYLITGNTLSVTTSSKVLVIRTDSSAGKQPLVIRVDGITYEPEMGTGTLWDSAVVTLDGASHRVEVTFQDMPPHSPILALFTLPGGSTTYPLNVTIPKIPGFSALGLKVTLLLRSDNVGNVLSRPFFTTNKTTVSILGETLTVVEVIIPFENVTLRGDFLKASYSYIYGFERKFGDTIQFPPYPEKLIYVNSPVFLNLSKGLKNMVIGSPPKIILSKVNFTEIYFKPVVYPVSFNVAQPTSLCGLTGVSYRVVTSSQVSGASETAAVLPGDNTTLTFRFFRGGLSLVDVIVSTPPPSFTINPPVYALSFTLYDKMGGKVANAYYTLYSQGRIIASGKALNGEGQVCPLPPGDYLIVVYVANNVIFRGAVQLSGDSYLPITTNTTTVQFTLIREGTGEPMSNYTLVLENAGLAYNTTSKGGRAILEGVVPGRYTFSVYISRDKVYEGVVEVSDIQNTFVFSLPVYRFKLQLLGALNQPLGNINLLVIGEGIRREALTDASGRADIGLLPQGTYRIIVGDTEYNVTLTSDSFKTISLDVVAILPGFTVTTSHLELALLILLLTGIVLAVRRILKEFKRGSPNIIEV